VAESLPCPAHFLQADFARVEDCRMVVAETDRLFGRLDVLVNAGASTARGTILDTTPETFDALFATNVRGPYFLMQAAIKLMIAKGSRARSATSARFPRWPGNPSSTPIAPARAR
jgi:NAD(P)-dependent dehydrogenase (short-subunit alcohol dehydrogenase family)